MFHPEDAIAGLQRQAPQRLETLSPAQGFALMGEFYRKERAEGAEGPESDMLLWQWGLWETRDQPWYQVNLTRQVILTEAPDPGSAEEEIWMLALSYRFAPDARLAALSEGAEWCLRPEDVDVFLQEIFDNPAFTACIDLPVGEAVLHCGRT